MPDDVVNIHAEDNNFKEEDPENIAYREFFEYKAVQKPIINKLEADNMVSEDAPVDPADAEKWFESLKQELSNLEGDYKFDMADKLSMLRFHTFKVQNAPENEDEVEYLIQENKDLLGNNFEHPKNSDFTDKTKPFDAFSTEDKINLFRKARSGELLFYSADGNPELQLSVYVKNGGAAGISKEPISAFSMFNDTFYHNLQDNPDFYKEIFPDAANPEYLAIHAAKFEGASKDVKRVLKLELPDPNDREAYNAHYEKLISAYNHGAYFQILNDMHEHPENYASKELSDERIEMIHNHYLGVLANEEKFEEVGGEPDCIDVAKTLDVYRNHPVEFANNFFTAIKKEIKMDLGSNYTMEDMFKNGIVEMDGNYARYSKDNKKPWDFSDKLINDVLAGKSNVFMTMADPKSGKMVPGKLSITRDGVKLKKAALLSQNDLKTIRDGVKMISKLMSYSGTSRRDSDEYTKFKESFDRFSERISSGLVELDTLKEELKSLSELAHDYFLAKVDQPMNLKRNTRIIASQAVGILAEKLLNGEKLDFTLADAAEHTIAAKITFETIRQSVTKDNFKNDPSVKSFKAFQTTVGALKHMEVFQNYFEKLDHKKLAENCEKSPKDLQKAMMKLEADKKKEMAKKQKAADKSKEKANASKQTQQKGLGGH